MRHTTGRTLTLGLLSLLTVTAAGCGDNSRAAAPGAVAGPGAPQAATGAETSPKIIQHDFGTVRHGSSVTVDIPVPVDTSRAWVPAGFSGDCSCARAQLVIRAADGDERIAPGNIVPRFQVREGETLLLRLTLDTARREPLDQPSAESRGQIILQDLSTSQVTRQVVGVLFTFGIDSPIEVRPTATLDFGQLAVSQDAKLTLRLKPSYQIPVQILSAKALSNRVQCALRPSGDDTLLDVWFRTDGRTTGPFQDVIEATTDLPDYTLRIIVAGNVQEDLAVLPMAILSLASFDFETPWAADKERFLTIVDYNPNRASEFEVLSVIDQDGDDASAYFPAALRAVEGNPKRRQLTVRYAGGYPKREFRGKVTVQCGTADVVGTTSITVLAFHKP